VSWCNKRRLNVWWGPSNVHTCKKKKEFNFFSFAERAMMKGQVRVGRDIQNSSYDQSQQRCNLSTKKALNKAVVVLIR